jgi:formylglycine-generating enzyme required for sulfatase activity/TolB-like protein
VDGVDDQLVAGLFVAAASNHARIVETILSEGMDADVPDDEGRNALQVAFECRAYDAAEVLIKDGAATNKRSVRVAVRAIADGATRAYLEALIARTDWELHRVQQRDKTAGPRVVGPKALTKYTDSTGITMVYVPSGSFIMGSPANEYERNTDEGPQRYVYVSGFWMDECEVTQESYERLMGENPSQYKDRRYPVDSVPWETAIEYCNKRSELEGLVPVYSDKGVDWNSGGYRLPTEAEWEYACRADTRTPFSTGESIDITQANYDGREPYLASQRAQPRNAWEAIKHATAYKGCPIPVKSMLANPWGLYDMHGNVCEWVGDGYAPYDITATNNPLGASNGPCPVLRGGSWYHAARSLRSARRINLSVEQTMAGCIGFRCVRTSHKNIPLVTQGLATEMAFRNILGDYSPTLVVPKNMLITNDLASAVAKLRKGFVWPCASCGALNEALSHHVGEPELCQCGQGAVISGVRSCSIAACPQCGVKHNIVRGSQGLYSCRSCRAPFLVANQATRMYAAARRYLPQFTALAREILSVRTKGVIAVMPLAATEQVTRAQAEYLALSLLSALNDALVTVAQDVSIVDRAATGQVMNELQLQKLYGDPQTRKQIGQQTNADMLLIGNTQIAEDVILLTVRITDVESGEQLLTRTISIPLTPRLRYLGKK